MSSRRRAITALLAFVAAAFLPVLPRFATPDAHAADGQLPAGGVLKVSVPEAFGGKTVVGQLAVDRVTKAGFVTAYGCANGLPTGADGTVARADLNFDGRVSPVWSNRLIVQADNAGDVCLYTSQPAAMVVDVNGVTFDTGINSFPNRRTDTRAGLAPGSAAALVAAAGTLRISVPEAKGAKTVVGQVAVDQVRGAGFVTAYGCADGLPVNADGTAAKADLNYDGAITPVWSNRLIVQADANGDVCIYTSKAAALVVDINGVSDIGVTSFDNRRTDTRFTDTPVLTAATVRQIHVPEAVESATVVGQIAVDRTNVSGFVTAYGCADGLPTSAAGVARADLNFDGKLTRAWSNRLIVQADAAGDICLYTSQPAALIVDINGVSDIGIQSFPNRRTDTRLPGAGDANGPVVVDGVPVWPPYVPLPGMAGVAALTGLPAGADVTSRPVIAVKIDNYATARPQWALNHADAVIEENAEGISRFVALFHSDAPSQIGPVRSARTGDLDLLAAMNRPVFAYSGANSGVNTWITTAAGSGLLVDYTAQRNPCYSRDPVRPGPHNLLLDLTCVLGQVTTAGPARPLWDTDAAWVSAHPAAPAVADTGFGVAMDGVDVRWEWDTTTSRYRRLQDGQPHVATDGEQIAADNVVVIATPYIPSPVDARSPNPITTGQGLATVHRDGRAYAATWTRPTAYDPFTFRIAGTNEPIALDTGTTYLELTRASGTTSPVAG